MIDWLIHLFIYLTLQYTGEAKEKYKKKNQKR